MQANFGYGENVVYMKAYFYNLEFFPEFDFGENGVLAVETSHFRFFRNIAEDMKGIAEKSSEIAFYEKDKRLIIEKDYFLFIDYYDAETIGKTVNGRILKKISAELEEDLAEHLKYSSLVAALYSFVLNRLGKRKFLLTAKENVHSRKF